MFALVGGWAQAIRTAKGQNWLTCQIDVRYFYERAHVGMDCTCTCTCKMMDRQADRLQMSMYFRSYAFLKPLTVFALTTLAGRLFHELIILCLNECFLVSSLDLSLVNFMS